MRNQVLCAIVGMASLFFVNGCKKPVEVVPPTLELETTEFTASAEGEVVSVPYVLANAEDGAVVSVKPAETYDWAEVTGIGKSAIEVTVAKNETTAARSASFTVSYTGVSDVEFTVSQPAGEEPVPEYDYEFEMTNFTSTWYGDQFGNNGEHNYYTWISDKPFTEDGYTQPGGTYYLFDIYASAPSDENTPTIPAGTYTLGAFEATERGTFTPDNSTGVRYGEEGKEWEVAFESGTLVVSYEGTTITMDAVMTDTEGKTHHVTYTGDGSCASDLPVVPGFGEDVDFNASLGIAGYLADDGSVMEVSMQFTDMDVDDEGYVTPPGYILAVDAIMPFDADGNLAPGTYTVSDDMSEFTLYPGMDFLGMGYIGTYATKFVSNEEVYPSLVTDGKMVVEGSDGKYTITCDFVASDGHTIKCSWTGEMMVSEMPGPISTLTGDYTLNLAGGTAEASMWGDYYMTGGNNWSLQIMPTSGPDGFIADFVSEIADFSAGIPSGTYKVAASSYPAPGEYAAGYMSGSKLGGTMYVGGFSEQNYVTQYAPATSGDMVITNNGDGTYKISFAFVDDLGYKWDGEWTGTIALTDETAGTASLSSTGSRHAAGSMVEANVMRGAQTLEEKAAVIRENSIKVNASSPKNYTTLRKIVK